MLSQWECFLKNLGEWQGSFTRFSPDGKQITDTPTIVTFEGLDNNKIVRQLVRRLPPNQPPQDQYFEYKFLGDNILFFEDGSFSIGATLCNDFSRPWAELGLKEGNHRLRLVQIFNSQNRLDYLSLIRETLANEDYIARPTLNLEQILGIWQGEATTLYPDSRSPNTFSTHLELDLQGTNQLQQKLTFGNPHSTQTITSLATIEGSKLIFTGSEIDKEILFLPDGVSANYPVEVKFGHPFFLEVGWLLKPDQRRRLIRGYNSQGEWASLTLVNEYKVS